MGIVRLELLDGSRASRSARCELSLDGSLFRGAKCGEQVSGSHLRRNDFRLDDASWRIEQLVIGTRRWWFGYTRSSRRR
jgi:hypothetical protein